MLLFPLLFCPRPKFLLGDNSRNSFQYVICLQLKCSLTNSQHNRSLHMYGLIFFLPILYLVLSSAAPWLWLGFLDAEPGTRIPEQLVYWGSAVKWTVSGCRRSSVKEKPGKTPLSLSLIPCGSLECAWHQELPHFEERGQDFCPGLSLSGIFGQWISSS